MNKDQTLLELFSAQSSQVSLRLFVIHLLLAGLLAFVLGRVYARFGSSISNRDQFGRNFLLVTMTTMVIITIVKSSLALSLGLVGALSIIRFRAAIKEPEELSYLFLAISLGLGFGAEQGLITVVAFAVIVTVMILRQVVRRRDEAPNFYVTVTCPAPGKTTVSQLTEIVQSGGARAVLRRFDETPDIVEAAFQVQFVAASDLDRCTARLRGLGEGVRVSFLDQNGVGA
jgi:hypothetical protein